MVFALAGNQNSGKTTLFNALTGSNQHVGNFPGVTVEQKTGEIRGVKDASVVDLPGIYSIRPYTPGYVRPLSARWHSATRLFGQSRQVPPGLDTLIRARLVSDSVEVTCSLSLGADSPALR